MTEGIWVFLIGFFGVFLGMAFLYSSVKITRAVVMRLKMKKEAQ